MLKRAELLSKLSMAISDHTGLPEGDRTRSCAEGVMDIMALYVVTPALDLVDWQDRPVSKEIRLNALRDLMALEQVVELPSDEPNSYGVPD